MDPNRFAVAFLAQTLALKNDEVILDPRHQALDVSPETKLMAVTRIESQKTTGHHAALSDAQRHKAVELILRTMRLRNVSAIQIDFDATNSERDFYRALLHDVRAKLPDNMALSMTALASFCAAIVAFRFARGRSRAMIFPHGRRRPNDQEPLVLRRRLSRTACQKSYGIAVDEPLDIHSNPAAACTSLTTAHGKRRHYLPK